MIKIKESLPVNIGLIGWYNMYFFHYVLHYQLCQSQLILLLLFESQLGWNINNHFYLNSFFNKIMKYSSFFIWMRGRKLKKVESKK